VLSALGELLITLGVFVLLFVGWELWWTDVTANRAQAVTVKHLVRDFTAHSPSTTIHPQDAVPGGGAFAIIRIPRFGASYARPIYEGTDHDTLTKGLGQYVGTALPGQVGNFSVAGHRTTYGRPLNEVQLLRNGDAIIVETAEEFYVYRVSSHEIVAPSDTAVIAPVPDQVGETPRTAYLTLTTCHPEYSARQRFIVHAVLDRGYPRAMGLPRDILTVPTGG
jgi:sortase A